MTGRFADRDAATDAAPTRTGNSVMHYQRAGLKITFLFSIAAVAAAGFLTPQPSGAADAAEAQARPAPAAAGAAAARPPVVDEPDELADPLDISDLPDLPDLSRPAAATEPAARGAARPATRPSTRASTRPTTG